MQRLALVMCIVGCIGSAGGAVLAALPPAPRRHPRALHHPCMIDVCGSVACPCTAAVVRRCTRQPVRAPITSMLRCRSQAFIVLVTGKLKAGQMETFIAAFKPLVGPNADVGRNLACCAVLQGTCSVLQPPGSEHGAPTCTRPCPCTCRQRMWHSTRTAALRMSCLCAMRTQIACASTSGEAGIASLPWGMLPACTSRPAVLAGWLPRPQRIRGSAFRSKHWPSAYPLHPNRTQHAQTKNHTHKCHAPITPRYTSKDFVEQVHWQSAPFKAFQQGGCADQCTCMLWVVCGSRPHAMHGCMPFHPPHPVHTYSAPPALLRPDHSCLHAQPPFAGLREAGIEWLEKSVVKYHEADVGFA